MNQARFKYNKRQVIFHVTSFVSHRIFRLFECQVKKPLLFTDEAIDHKIIQLYRQDISDMLEYSMGVKKNKEFGISVGRAWCRSYMEQRGIHYDD